MADNSKPAFPGITPGYARAQTGMTLRQYYAGQALIGMSGNAEDTGNQAIARRCTELADALIAELEK